MKCPDVNASSQWLKKTNNYFEYVFLNNYHDTKNSKLAAIFFLFFKNQIVLILDSDWPRHIPSCCKILAICTPVIASLLNSVFMCQILNQ